MTPTVSLPVPCSPAPAVSGGRAGRGVAAVLGSSGFLNAATAGPGDCFWPELRLAR